MFTMVIHTFYIKPSALSIAVSTPNYYVAELT